MILTKPFREGRARKAAETLVHEGYDVTLLVRETTVEDEVSDLLNKVTIIQLPKIINKRVSHILTQPNIINPIYLISLLKILFSSSFDILHVHDLPLAPMSIILGKLLFMNGSPWKNSWI